MWKLFIILLFVGVGIKAGTVWDEDEDCEDCNEQIDDLTKEAIPNALQRYQPFKTNIPDCEQCDVGGFTNIKRNNDSCVIQEEDCKEQITHFKMDSAFLNCSCELNTESGKNRGGIHGTVVKSMFSIRISNCPNEVDIPHFHEDGHIGAEKLHIKCDGDDDFKKACEEEEHGYNVDNVVTAVGRAIVDILNSNLQDEFKKNFECY